MKHQTALPLTLLLCELVGCRTPPTAPATLQEHGPDIGSSLNRHALARAGANAINCGWSGDKVDFEAISNCAIKAAEAHKPFVAQLRLFGIDSAAQIAYQLAPDGKFIRYAMGDGEFIPGNVWFAFQTCEPSSLHKTNQGILECQTTGNLQIERE